MQNRLDLKLARGNSQKVRKIFCAFLTLGFPDQDSTRELMRAFEKEGVDILELGFPFSDPLADGPTIQYSSEQAIKKGVKIEDAFKLVSQLRSEGCKLPILFFTYLNPIYHFGLKKFIRRAKEAGFDGMIVPDLPPEEEKEIRAECKKLRFHQVFLVAPTTEKERASFIAEKSGGFIYYVSLRGVTGARKALPQDIKRNIAQLRKVTSKPILIGFGVSSPEQGKKLSALSEGVIVGSAIVEKLRSSGGRIEPAINYIREMVRAVKGTE